MQSHRHADNKWNRVSVRYLQDPLLLVPQYIHDFKNRPEARSGRQADGDMRKVPKQGEAINIRAK